jgi:hypothetical protein
VRHLGFLLKDTFGAGVVQPTVASSFNLANAGFITANVCVFHPRNAESTDAGNSASSSGHAATI